MATSTRDRLVRSAFELFGRQGFEQTTVDEIAAHAGVGRTTFFRLFASKEAVIFPDHDALAAAVDSRLAAGDASTLAVALHEAARLVLRHYLDEGDLARERYRLTRTVPALRAAEIAGQLRYQRVFRERVRPWLGDGADLSADLRAEVLANAVVSAHNHVLRRWLRQETKAPEDDLAAALLDLVPRLTHATPDAATQVVVLRTTRDVGELVPALRRLLAD